MGSAACSPKISVKPASALPRRCCGRQRIETARVDETEKNTGPARFGPDVEGDEDRALVGERLAGQSLITPERMRIGGIGLSQCALRPPLRQLLVRDRRGGGDIDVESMGRRNRHDGAPGLHHAGRGHHRDRVIGPLDPGDGRTQSHAVAEFGGHGGGDLMAAAGEVVLLGAADDVEHAVQPTGGVDVAHRVQHRHLVGLSAPGHPRHDGHQVAGGRRGAD